MSTGPIEFVRAEPVDDLGSTEYGGDPGLIQGQPKLNAAGLSGKGVDHLAHLTTAERLQVLKRTKSHAFVDVTVDEDGATTVVHGTVVDGIDPKTGLTVEDADADDAAPGQPATDFIGGPNAQ